MYNNMMQLIHHVVTDGKIYEVSVMQVTKFFFIIILFFLLDLSQCIHPK